MVPDGFMALLSQTLQAVVTKHGCGATLTVLEGLFRAHVIHQEFTGHGFFVRLHFSKSSLRTGVSSAADLASSAAMGMAQELPPGPTPNATALDGEIGCDKAAHALASMQAVTEAGKSLAKSLDHPKPDMTGGQSGGRQTWFDLSEGMGEPESDPLVESGQHETTKWRKKVQKKKREERGADEEYTGVVERFFRDRGFGYIKPDAGGADLFVHHAAIEGSGLWTGQKVRFKREADSKRSGCWKAVRVEASWE